MLLFRSHKAGVTGGDNAKENMNVKFATISIRFCTKAEKFIFSTNKETYLYMGVPLSSLYHNMSSISSLISCVLMLHGRYTVSPIRASIEKRGTEIESQRKYGY